MPYSLERKIEALDRMSGKDGCVARTSRALGVSSRTLREWKANEKELRREHRQWQRRRKNLLAQDMQLRMLERGRAVLDRMENEPLKAAPLNQMARALGQLVSSALNLEEAIDIQDEPGERVIRFEHYYDGKVQDAPPWANACKECGSPLQSGGLRTALGENGARSDDAADGGD